MTIGNTFRIKVHLFFYIFMFISLVTGNFWDYVVFTSIIIFHELGHILGGFLFSWHIKEVILLPFGGLTIFNNLINTSLFEQFVVTLLGPLFQVIFYFFLSLFFNLSNSVIYFNFVILIFNLLPIYPLDGSKFLYVFLCLIFPFKYSHLILIFVSFLFCFFVIIFVGHFDLLIYLIVLFLVIRCFNEFNNHSMIFNKFLFEKYNYDFNFSRLKKVDSYKKMFLCCRHLFFYNNKYITERNYLSKMFDNHSDL